MLLAVAVGAVLGFLAGLGIGGGSLLILWLTLVSDMEPGKAQTINLMFFLTAAGSVTIYRWWKGRLRFEKILPGVLCGCTAAAVASLAAGIMDIEILKKMFGLLLLFTGTRELLYRPRKAK